MKWNAIEEAFLPYEKCVIDIELEDGSTLMKCKIELKGNEASHVKFSNFTVAMTSHGKYVKIGVWPMIKNWRYADEQ